MSCLIIFLSFIFCFQKKYPLTYANSVNPDQTPYVAPSVVGMHGKSWKENPQKLKENHQPILDHSIQLPSKF